MIEYSCPHCQHELELPDEFAGARATCTRCGVPFAVPEAQGAMANEDIWAEVYGSDANAAGSGTGREVEAPGSAGRELPPDDPDVPDWIEERQRLRRERLGPMYWAAAYFLPPAAILWGLALPLRHPQKKIAVALPCVWLLVLSSVGLAGTYLAPQLTTQAETSAPRPAEEPSPSLSGSSQSNRVEPQDKNERINVTQLNVGEMYRVTKSPVPLWTRMSDGDGFGSMVFPMRLPVGGVFRIVRVAAERARPWYEVVVTDGERSFTMWIKYRNLIGAGLVEVPPPSFNNPTPPPSVPVEPLFDR